MKIDDQKLKDILSKESYVTPENIKDAEAYATEHHISLADYLLSKSLITKDLLGQAVAESFSVPYADLNSRPPKRDEVLKVPEAVATQYRCVVFSETAKEIKVATEDPTQAGLAEAIQKIFPGKTIKIEYAMPEDIAGLFAYYRQSLDTRFVGIIKKQKRVAPEIIGEIIDDAVLNQASDIHFEPQEKEVVIRFRVDGVLREVGRLAKEFYDNILNRIKVQAHLQIDQHYEVQDGAIRYLKDDKETDIRVSIAPTLDGEKVVMRVLSQYIRGFALADLGLSAAHQVTLEKTARKPFGMILVTGPTGSGKTTTLYALLKTLNRPEVNITSIEDPVEYKVTGVNQIQVNPQTNITFAQGLRSIVRQDPNIILVGEIRDQETAEIAVNAALTGHLLLSTFHANDAPTTIPRLLNMGIEPFLLASTLELVIAQRLVRRICESCRYSYAANLSDLQKIIPDAKRYFPKKKLTLYKGKGCNACGDTGYKGRIAVFEFIEITAEMEDLMLKSPSTREIWALARKQNAVSLFEDGIEKVQSGVTTVEELLRVAQPPID